MEGDAIEEAGCGGGAGVGMPNFSPMDESSMSAKRAKFDISAESDRLLNFATAADEFELSLKRHKIPRDPMSHRIIEKRRRDRMNNCLADLSRLIPASYHKQGQGRIEKTEIIEMAIKHINLLQKRVDELEKKVKTQEEGHPLQAASTIPPIQTTPDCSSSKFYLGFKEAQDEVMRFLVEVESINTVDPFCMKIMKHLENAGSKFIIKDQKTEVSLMDGGAECVSHPSPIFSHHSAFYPTTSGGVGGIGPPSVSISEEGQTNVSGSGGMDVKSREDNHLRYLIGDQSNPLVGRSGMVETGQEAGEDRTGSVPMFSYTSHLSGVGSSVVGSSGYFSDASNMDKNSPGGSTSSRENVYKFKHNITKRFSQEGRHHHHHRYSHHHHMKQHHNQQTSDSSSNTSSRDLEDDQGQLRWKGNTSCSSSGGSGSKHHKGSGCSSSYNLYTDDTGTDNQHSPHPEECSNSGSNSGNSSSYNTIRSHHNHHHHHHNRGYNNNNNSNNNNNNSSNKNCQSGGGRSSPLECHNSTSLCSPSVSTASSNNTTNSVALPGFILHPTGTHYMPISVHNSNITGMFESSGDQEGMPVFHPISIPVHFRRPVISMPNITICTHLSSKIKDCSSKD